MSVSRPPPPPSALCQAQAQVQVRQSLWRVKTGKVGKVEAGLKGLGLGQEGGHGGGEAGEAEKKGPHRGPRFS